MQLQPTVWNKMQLWVAPKQRVQNSMIWDWCLHFVMLSATVAEIFTNRHRNRFSFFWFHFDMFLNLFNFSSICPCFSLNWNRSEGFQLHFTSVSMRVCFQKKAIDSNMEAKTEFISSSKHSNFDQCAPSNNISPIAFLPHTTRIAYYYIHPSSS